MKKNILFSTTRQFNIGDEAILFGILNLFDATIGRERYNPIIYNRNPDIRSGAVWGNWLRSKKFTCKRIKRERYLKSFIDMDFYDNSIKDDSNFQNIDMVVFAGTPEWYGARVKSLYDHIEKYHLPCIYLGIGTGEADVQKRLSIQERNVLKKAKLICVRDENTQELLRQYNSREITCPSLLSNPFEGRVVSKVSKIGLIYSSSRVSVNNKISKETENYCNALYSYFMQKYETEFICHYVDEIDEIVRDYPDSIYHYSYNAGDYHKIYSQFDLVIGCRVHGIGIAASLGIPGVIIKHDHRGDTARGFCSIVIDSYIDELADEIDKIEGVIDNIECKSREILQKKELVKKEYMKRINSLWESIE